MRKKRKRRQTPSRVGSMLRIQTLKSVRFRALPVGLDAGSGRGTEIVSDTVCEFIKVQVRPFLFILTMPQIGYP